MPLRQRVASLWARMRRRPPASPVVAEKDVAKLLTIAYAAITMVGYQLELVWKEGSIDEKKSCARNVRPVESYDEVVSVRR